MDIEPTENLASKLYCYRRDFLKKVINAEDKYTLIKSNVRLYNLFSSTVPIIPLTPTYPFIKFPDGSLEQTITPRAVGVWGIKSPIALTAPYSISFKIFKLNVSADSYVCLGLTDNNSNPFVDTQAATHYPLSPDNGSMVALGRIYTTVPTRGWQFSLRLNPFAYISENYPPDYNAPEDGMIFTIRELILGKMEYNIFSIQNGSDKTFSPYNNPRYIGNNRYIFLSASTPAYGPSFTFKMVPQPF